MVTPRATVARGRLESGAWLSPKGCWAMDDGEVDGGHRVNGHVPDAADGRAGERRDHKRPPVLGALKRQADAQAPSLRAQLHAIMRLDGPTLEEIARRARLDLAALTAFEAGASINPRWQEKLAAWLDRAADQPGDQSAEDSG